jgi:prepilin peptidase CpaA
MPVSVYFYLLIQLIFVSYGDIKTKKIPNLWAILNILSFFIFIFIFPEYYQFKLPVFIYSFTFLGVGFILFLLKIMGAGDVKYLFSLFPLIPFKIQDHLFVYLLISTVIVGVFLLSSNTIRNFKEIRICLNEKRFLDLKKFYGKKFSYAPVILLSWIFLAVFKWKEITQ